MERGRRGKSAASTRRYAMPYTTSVAEHFVATYNADLAELRSLAPVSLPDQEKHPDTLELRCGDGSFSISYRKRPSRSWRRSPAGSTIMDSKRDAARAKLTPGLHCVT